MLGDIWFSKEFLCCRKSPELKFNNIPGSLYLGKIIFKNQPQLLLHTSAFYISKMVKR